MTEKRIVFQRPDGGITVIIPVDGSTYHKKSASEKEWFAGLPPVLELQAEGGIRLLDCLASSLPGRRFRNCWRDDGSGRAAVDMPLAREQRLGEIRKERNARFPELDREWMKATGQGDKVLATAIEAARQTLRDIPQSIDLDAIATAEKLAAFEPKWPILKEL